MSKAFLIDPYELDVSPIELDTNKVEAIHKFAGERGGTVQTIALKTGDVLVSAAGLDETHPQWGFFDATMPEDAMGFDEGENTIVMRGMAILAGPVQEDGTYADVSYDNRDVLGRHIGYDAQHAQKHMMKMLMQALGAAAALSDDGEVDRDMLTKLVNGGVNRDAITDDQLRECGCDGCKEELELRQNHAKKKRGDGTAIH